MEYAGQCAHHVNRSTNSSVKSKELDVLIITMVGSVCAGSRVSLPFDSKEVAVEMYVVCAALL